MTTATPGAPAPKRRTSVNRRENQMTQKLLTVLTLSLGLTALGCLSEGEAAENEAEPELGTTQQAITGGKNYAWPPLFGSETPLEPLNKSFCYLISIQGNFDTPNDWVRVDNDGTSWVMRGSTPANVGALARCVPLALTPGRKYSYPDTKRWDHFQPRIFLGGVTDRVCFLMGAKGTFNGAGEKVELTKIQGGWYLGGSSGSVTNGLGGWASCLINHDGNQAGPYPWQQGSSSVQTGLFAESWACGLTKMQGRFRGSSEYLRAALTPRAGGGYQWAMTGGSNQQGVAGAMTCAY
jgi:hypothetical protein